MITITEFVHLRCECRDCEATWLRSPKATEPAVCELCGCCDTEYVPLPKNTEPKARKPSKSPLVPHTEEIKRLAAMGLKATPITIMLNAEHGTKFTDNQVAAFCRAEGIDIVRSTRHLVRNLKNTPD